MKKAFVAVGSILLMGVGIGIGIKVRDNMIQEKIRQEQIAKEQEEKRQQEIRLREFEEKSKKVLSLSACKNYGPEEVELIDSAKNSGNINNIRFAMIRIHIKRLLLASAMIDMPEVSKIRSDISQKREQYGSAIKSFRYFENSEINSEAMQKLFDLAQDDKAAMAREAVNNGNDLKKIIYEIGDQPLN
jgi:hypothetical protein